MKKFIYVAILAVMVVFAGCKSGANGSDYYKGGNKVLIDAETGKVNGVKYDNTEPKCWMWTLTEKSQGTTITFDYYVWATEFELVASCETVLYETARNGGTASYAYIHIPGRKTEYDCDLANNNNNN